MNFAVQGALTKSLAKIKKTTAKLGGKVVRKIDKHTIALFSDKSKEKPESFDIIYVIMKY
jgi:hypothetical protein